MIYSPRWMQRWCGSATAMDSKVERAYPYQVRKVESYWVISFRAMASPCEILVRCENRSEAEDLASLSYEETSRIEQKFSRYRRDSVVSAINTSNGRPVEVDQETARLLHHADQCYQLSEGLFDITSGVLRRAWKFDGGQFTPDRALIASLREKIGWEKVEWDGRSVTLQSDMEIDLGGIGKEYAVDLVADLLFRELPVPLMVNFGGDIRAIATQEDDIPWIVGIENPDQEGNAIGQVELANGAIATSGDARRFCFVDGVRMGHILNPKTGWPIVGAPRSVTVLGDYCVEAGFLATLAMLQGPQAESFLHEQEAACHCIW